MKVLKINYNGTIHYLLSDLVNRVVSAEGETGCTIFYGDDESYSVQTDPELLLQKIYKDDNFEIIDVNSSTPGIGVA